MEENTIGISPDFVGKYYSDETLPESGDGILGFVPDIAQQWEASKLTGEDIQVPTADMLAHMDPEVFKELQDGMRVRPEGFTKKDEPLEAGATDETQHHGPLSRSSPPRRG